MVIVQLAGGLGNQMFQYALYLQLKSLGREVKIDDVSGFLRETWPFCPSVSPMNSRPKRNCKRCWTLPCCLGIE